MNMRSISHTGHVWVERTDPAHLRRPMPLSVDDAPASWDVFDPSGRWLGNVIVPVGFGVFDVG